MLVQQFASQLFYSRQDLYFTQETAGSKRLPNGHINVDVLWKSVANITHPES